TTLDPYLYRQKKTPEATDPELAAMDSLYNPTPPPRQHRGNQVRMSNRYRPASTRYRETPLPDEFDEEAVRPRDVQKQVDDRQRLLALLTEYKRDKEAKAEAAREGERPQKAETGAVVSTLGESNNRRLNGFYGLYSSDQKGKQEAALTEELGTIRAVIHQDQQIADGGRVQLRLLEPVTVRGIRIPANTLVYGTGSFGTERVGITLSNLQYESRIFPIKLTVHDMDGMPGVFVPNVLAAQEGKQILGQTLGGANYNLNGSSATSAKAAATMAGISAAQSGLSGARSVLQRKIIQQKATLKGNYYVLLK
ncbi:MAG TPA: conjugative transposon protein TraM, partial [Fibrella sp.]